jgi:hypothetical protein
VVPNECHSRGAKSGTTSRFLLQAQCRMNYQHASVTSNASSANTSVLSIWFVTFIKLHYASGAMTK